MFRSKLKSYYEFYRNQGVIENFKFTDKVFHRRSIEFPVFIDKRLSTHNPNKISNNPSEWLPSEKLKLTLTLHYYLIHPVHNNNLKFEKSCSSWEKVHTNTDLIFLKSRDPCPSSKTKVPIFIQDADAPPRNPILEHRCTCLRRSTGFNDVNGAILVWIVAPVVDGVI